MQHGFRIPFVSGIRDSLSCIRIPKPMLPDSGFHKQKFPGFRNPDSLTLGDQYNITHSELPKHSKKFSKDNL